MTPVQRLVLIDGHSILYRSFFAFIRNPLRNSRGENTSAPFGFANTVRKVLKELRPDLCAVVFDSPEKTFRDELFAGYKAQRPPAPKELTACLPVVKEMVRAWGMEVFEVPGVEADDVIGTIAELGKRRGLEVVVVSSDKDMLQLVNDQIRVYDPWKETLFGPAEVKEKLGVGPERVADFLALTGDASDNIPGVPGIGPKRALDILKKFKTLTEASEADARLKSAAEALQLSRRLALIRRDARVDVRWEKLKLREPDRNRLVEIYRQLEFSSLLAEFAERQEGQEIAVRVVSAGNGVELRRLQGSRCLGICYEPGQGLWVSGDGETALLLAGDAPEATRWALEAEGPVRCGFEIKEVVKALRRQGFDIRGEVFDLGIGAWLIDPNRKRFGVSDVTASILGRPSDPRTGGERAALFYRIYQALLPQIQALGLAQVARGLEMPLIFVLAGMEERGVKVDLTALSELEETLKDGKAQVEKQIYDCAGIVFNVNSPKQLAEVLFGRLKLPRGRRTKTGYSTSSDVLEGLAHLHPVVRLVLRYRELDKLISTYLVPLREMADKDTHRVHTRFNQTGTSTGRISSSEPNLQNIPIRGELGSRIREGFIADQGMRLISADYSQIELRILAHFTRDERLIEYFKQDRDIHAATAAALLGISPDEVTEEQRRLAKMVNYGIIYGMADWGLSARMDIPVEQARAFIEQYYSKFPGVALWREQVFEQAKQHGFVRTIAGRIRPIPEIMSGDRQTGAAALRAALNAPIQGSAADIIKRAMLAIDQELRSRGFTGGIILQIHDELLVEVEEHRVEQAQEIVRAEMEAAWRLNVPLKVQIGAGRTWGEAHR